MTHVPLRSFPHQHYKDSQPRGRGWGFAGGLRDAAGGEQHCHLAWQLSENNVGVNLPSRMLQILYDPDKSISIK